MPARGQKLRLDGRWGFCKHHTHRPGTGALESSPLPLVLSSVSAGNRAWGKWGLNSRIPALCCPGSESAAGALGQGSPTGGLSAPMVFATVAVSSALTTRRPSRSFLMPCSVQQQSGWFQSPRLSLMGSSQESFYVSFFVSRWGKCVLQHTCRARRTAYWSRFSPVTWVLGTELWPSILAADTFTCWAIAQPQQRISRPTLSPLSRVLERSLT